MNTVSPTLPGSVSVILRQLKGSPPMTGKQLREATGLPRRTIYTALRKLREMGVLQERQSLRDTRQTYFWLRPEEPQVQPAAATVVQQPNWVPAV